MDLFTRLMKDLGVKPMPKAITMLDTLRKDAAALDLTPPQKVEVKGMGATRAAVEQQHAKINQLRGNLFKALEWERDVEDELASLKTPDERRLLRKELQGETDKVEAFLKECYAEADPIFRISIAVTLIKFFLQKTCRSLEDYHTAAYQLKKRGLLGHAKKDDPEAMRIGHEDLSYINCAIMEREENAEVRRLAASFTQRMHDEWNRRTRGLRQQATITVEQFLAGSSGKCSIELDKEEIRGKDGGYRSGGHLLLESKDGRVTLLDGAGGAPFSLWRDYVLEKRMYLTFNQVRARHKPGHTDAFPKMVKAIQKETGLSEKDAEEYVKKLQRFWYYIRQAAKVAQQKQEASASQQA